MRHETGKRLSRRQFLGRAAALAAATAEVAAGAEKGGGDSARIAELAKRVPTRAKPPAASQVVIVTDRRVWGNGGTPDPDVLRTMLDRALMALSGKADAPEAWRAYFRKDDFVALKYNELGGRAIQTSAELRAIVADALRKHVGVAGEKIVPIGRCTQYRGKYRGWGKAHRIHTFGFTTQFSSVFDEHATAILNMPVCKTHQSGGVTCALKNHLGSIKNPYMFCGDDDWPRLWKNLPELSSLATIRKKQRLIIVDALRPQYHKGPLHDPAYRFRRCAVMVSTDPVSVDAVALKLITEARRKKGLPALPHTERMLAFAESLGVGLADEKKVKVTEIDLTPGKTEAGQ